jgi:hypothetical protein
MIVAGIVVEAAAGAAERVAERLVARGLEVAGREGSRIAAVCEAASGEELERLTERLVAEDDEILGVFPSYVGADA